MATDLVRDIIQDIRTPLYRNATFLIMNTALVAGAGFLFWFVVTHLYGEEDVGQAFILIGVATFLATLSQLGFGTGLIRFLPGTRRDRGKMINSCLTISTIASIVLAVILLASVDLWFPQGRGLLRFWLLVPIFLLLVPMQVNAPIVNSTFVAGRKASFVLLKTSLFQGTRLLMPLLLVGLLGVLGILASFVFAHVIALSVSFFLLLPRLYPGFRPGPAISGTVVNDILHFSLGNHVAEVLYALPYPVILLFISTLTGSVEQAAFFAIPWLVASMLFAIPLMTSVSLYAEGSHFEDRLHHDLIRTLRFLVPLLALGTLFLWFLGGWVLSLFGSSYAVEGTDLLRILTLSGIFVAINGVFMSVARVKKWVKAIIALMAYITTVTILLSYWFIPIFGLEGTGIAWIISHGTASAAVVGFYLFRRRPQRLSSGKDA